MPATRRGTTRRGEAMIFLALAMLVAGSTMCVCTVAWPSLSFSMRLVGMLPGSAFIAFGVLMLGSTGT